MQSYKAIIMRKLVSEVKLFSGRNGLRKALEKFRRQGEILPFPDFQRKYSLEKTYFLHYCQVISGIPGHPMTKVKFKDLISTIG